MVSRNVFGSENRMISISVEKLELLRTTMSRICSSGFMNRMKLNSAQPSTACEEISPRM